MAGVLIQDPEFPGSYLWQHKSRASMALELNFGRAFHVVPTGTSITSWGSAEQSPPWSGGVVLRHEGSIVDGDPPYSWDLPAPGGLASC